MGSSAGWRLGVQTYTFNRFTLFESIDKTREIGLDCIEAYPGQRLSPQEPDTIFSHEAASEVHDKVRAKLADAGVTLANYGVVVPDNDEGKLRRLFAFAQSMRIETITAESEPDVWDRLEALTEEFRINLAVHNHPRPSRYWSPDAVLSAIEGRNSRIGVCADTGHWVRSGLDPLECLKKVADKLTCLHMKDINTPEHGTHDVIWGQGQCRIRELLLELHRRSFKGVFAAEYEHNWENSLPDVAECVKHFNQVRAELER